MTFNETAVVVIGLLAGYWIIDALLNRSSKPQINKKPTNQGAGGKSSGEIPVNGNSDYEKYISTNWYRILEVAEDANHEQITKAYQQMLAQYHPDKVAHMGAEFHDLAAFKSKQIEDAYNHAVSITR